MSIIYIQLFATLVFPVATSIAATNLILFPTEKISVSSEKGDVSGFVQVAAISGYLGNPKHWTTYIHTVYLPSSGNGWAGWGWGWNLDPRSDSLALVDNVILGLFAAAQPERETLHITVSTNRHMVGLTNVSSVMQTEFMCFTNSRRRFDTRPPYTVQLRRLLGFEMPLRGGAIFATDIRPVRFKALTVEGVNAVVTLEVGTNTLARVAFTKEIVPVWATTNGVSIGTIPTNCVYYSDIVSKKVVTRVVY